MTTFSKSVDDEQKLMRFSTSRQLDYFPCFGRHSRLQVGFVIQVLTKFLATQSQVADQSIQIVSTDANIWVNWHMTKRLNTASHNFTKLSSLTCAT